MNDYLLTYNKFNYYIRNIYIYEHDQWELLSLVAGISLLFYESLSIYWLSFLYLWSNGHFGT